MVGDQLLKNSHDTIVTLGIVALVAKETLFLFRVIKKWVKDANDVPMLTLMFIDLCDSFDEDGTLPPMSKLISMPLIVEVVFVVFNHVIDCLLLKLPICPWSLTT
jgi:hypothetical protein